MATPSTISSVEAAREVEKLWRLVTRPVVLIGRILSRHRMMLWFSLLLTCVAAFRSFGFDYDQTLFYYPYVADGWGLWYWLAQTGISFPVFFFIVNAPLALLILLIAFPEKRKGYSRSLIVQVATLSYMTLWFLFGQARYGTAIGLLVCAIGCESWPVIIVLCVLAVLIHKATAGAVVLLLLWRRLKNEKYGLLLAAALCAVFTYIVMHVADALLQLSGYSNYLNWELLPSPNTPYKYLYFAVLIVIFLLFTKRAGGKILAKELLVLTLLFFPFSFYLAFAGRSYQLYAVVVLSLLSHNSVSRMLRYLVLSVYFFDLYLLVFRSGCFAVSGCMGP